MAPLLQVENLRIELTTRDGIAPVIDDLSFSLNAGETISFVGESGCGKSMTALGIMGLLPEKIGRIASGTILFDGEDLTRASDAHLREIRGNDISMIFQEPMTSLNPVYTIGEQIAEVLRRHQGLGHARRARQGDRSSRRSSYSQSESPGLGLPASDVRWAAPTRHDRHSARL